MTVGSKLALLAKLDGSTFEILVKLGNTWTRNPLIHAFITARLDINNSLYLGVAGGLLDKLQVLQNAAARLIVRIPKHSHITPTLMELHWLPVRQRIKFKVLLTVFKALNDLASVYIKELLTSKPQSFRSMCSNSNNLLVVPVAHGFTYGGQSFKCMPPHMWNDLPLELRRCNNLEHFKRKL